MYTQLAYEKTLGHFLIVILGAAGGKIVCYSGHNQQTVCTNMMLLIIDTVGMEMRDF